MNIPYLCTFYWYSGNCNPYNWIMFIFTFSLTIQNLIFLIKFWKSTIFQVIESKSIISRNENLVSAWYPKVNFFFSKLFHCSLIYEHVCIIYPYLYRYSTHRKKYLFIRYLKILVNCIGTGIFFLLWYHNLFLIYY